MFIVCRVQCRHTHTPYTIVIRPVFASFFGFPYCFFSLEMLTVWYDGGLFAIKWKCQSIETKDKRKSTPAHQTKAEKKCKRGKHDHYDAPPPSHHIYLCACETEFSKLFIIHKVLITFSYSFPLSLSLHVISFAVHMFPFESRRPKCYAIASKIEQIDMMAMLLDCIIMLAWHLSMSVRQRVNT